MPVTASSGPGFIAACIGHARPVLSLLAFLLTAGAATYLTIPREAEPDINIPKIYVSMHHEGISPADSERLLIRPMEQELRSVEGIREMRATAYQGGGNVIVEFDAGFEVEQALEDIRAKVDLAKSKLPTDSDEPVVREINLSLFPILVVILSGNVPERKLLAVATDLQQRLRAIPQILKADIAGERKRQLDVIIDPVKVRNYGLTAPQVVDHLLRNNALVASGLLDVGQGSFAVTVPGLVESAADFLAMPITTPAGATLTVADIAELRQGFQDATGFARLGGQRSIALEISKRTGSNIIETIEEVRAVIEDERNDWPSSLSVTYTQDKAKNIRRMLNDLQNSVILAVLLVVVVLMLALGTRASLLVSVGIPGSFLTGLLVLGLSGVTVNIVVLFSLILSVGMLVDGAVVVTEYADRLMNLGTSRRQAYARASRLMAPAVITATVTTLLAFMPLLFWPGIVGEFMRYMPLTLITILTASLLMALIFLPVIGAYVGAPGALSPRALRTLKAGEAGDFRNVGAIAAFYLKVMKVCLAYPGRVVAAAVVALVLAQGLYVAFGRGVEFFPKVEPDNAVLKVHARGNLSIYEKDAILREVEERILALDGVAYVYTRTGASSEGRGSGEDVIGSIYLEFADWRRRDRASVILARAEERLSDLAGIVVEMQRQKAGPPVGKAVQLRLSGSNTALVEATARKARRLLEATPGFINIEDDATIPGIQWDLNINREEAARFGADIRLVGSAVNMATRGLKVGEYRPDDSFEEIDIMVRFPPAFRRIQELDRIFVHTATGDVPISNFVKREAVPKVGVLRRADGYRAITVRADVREGVLADDKVRDLQSWLQRNPLPRGVTVVFKGEDEEQKKAAAFLGKAFLTAMFLIALTLLTRFNNFFHTFLILSAVVMSTTGVVLGLLVTNTPFSIVMSGIGVVALAGIVVNNNIILIDTFSYIRKRVSDPTEAILRTGIQRLRPVLLTTATTILGLLPMVLGVNIDFIEREIAIGGPSTQWWRQLSSAIAFGLAFSTVLTLVVTPSALMLAARYAEARRTRRRAAYEGSEDVSFRRDVAKARGGRGD